MLTLNLSDDAGQATVEMVAFLPLLVAMAIGIFAVVSASAASEVAASSAHAGVIALLQEHDAKKAAREAIPAPLRRKAAVVVGEGRVTVTVVPPVALPGLEGVLTARSSATSTDVRK